MKKIIFLFSFFYSLIGFSQNDQLAQNYFDKGEFEKALEAVDDFATSPSLGENSRKAAAYRRKSFEFAIAHAKTHQGQYVFEPKNLGDSINTKFP